MFHRVHYAVTCATYSLQEREVDEYRLPEIISAISGQSYTLIGDAILETNDTCFGFEICEEIWSPKR